MAKDLGDDLDGPTEDTDKNPLPQIAKKKKLTLPKPDDFDDDPTPVPRAPAPPQPPLKPQPPRLKRIPVFQVKPEKSGSPIVLGVVALTVGLVVAAFFLAPDGKSSAEIARRQLNAPEKRETAKHETSIRDWFSFGSSPQQPAEKTVAARADRKIPSRTAAKVQRHADVARKRPGERPLANESDRFGFERTDPPKRLYDNYDSSREQGNGIPMLMVFSKPPGMAVDADGQLIGMTPLIRQLPKDTKRVKIRVHGAGFKDWEQTVTPNQIEQFKVGVTMERIAE